MNITKRELKSSEMMTISALKENSGVRGLYPKGLIETAVC